MGELAGGIAHEINQPLNVMRLATMNLRNHLNKQSVLDSKASESIEKLNLQVERAANIVRQLLLYGQEAGDQATVTLVAIRNTEQMIGRRCGWKTSHWR